MSAINQLVICPAGPGNHITHVGKYKFTRFFPFYVRFRAIAFCNSIGLGCCLILDGRLVDAAIKGSITEWAKVACDSSNRGSSSNHRIRII